MGVGAPAMLAALPAMAKAIGSGAVAAGCGLGASGDQLFKVRLMGLAVGDFA